MHLIQTRYKTQSEVLFSPLVISVMSKWSPVLQSSALPSVFRSGPFWYKTEAITSKRLAKVRLTHLPRWLVFLDIVAYRFSRLSRITLIPQTETDNSKPYLQGLHICPACSAPTLFTGQRQLIVYYLLEDATSSCTSTFWPLQEAAAITEDYQPNNEKLHKERHWANAAARRLAYSSTLRTLIAIYVPSLREHHNGPVGSLLFWSLLFVGVTSYNHNRNFQNPYLRWHTKSISEL